MKKTPLHNIASCDSNIQLRMQMLLGMIKTIQKNISIFSFSIRTKNARKKYRTIVQSTIFILIKSTLIYKQFATNGIIFRTTNLNFHA